MIGIVIVSHSARLAEGVCELAAQVARGKVRLAAAGGTSEPSNPIGTDAPKVLAAMRPRCIPLRFPYSTAWVP